MFQLSRCIRTQIFCVQPLDVITQVRLPAARGGAVLALEGGLVAGVDAAVLLQRVALREARVADIALVGLLPRVDAQVSLQLERAGRGVSAVRTLGQHDRLHKYGVSLGVLPGMHSFHMPPKLGAFNASISTIFTNMFLPILIMVIFEMSFKMLLVHC